MPDKSDEEIRTSIKRIEESLPETERNPDAQEDTQRLHTACVTDLLHDFKG